MVLATLAMPLLREKGDRHTDRQVELPPSYAISLTIRYEVLKTSELKELSRTWKLKGRRELRTRHINICPKSNNYIVTHQRQYGKKTWTRMTQQISKRPWNACNRHT